MKMPTQFGLIGDGRIAKYHRAAIAKFGELAKVSDPMVHGYGSSVDERFFDGLDYVVIACPTNLHRRYTIEALGHGCRVIVEKPMCLPWEPIVDDDRVSVVLQLRYAFEAPFPQCGKVFVRMVRDAGYFASDKGDSKVTGGLFFNVFIHYIDLAHILDADFEGLVAVHGEQARMAGNYDLSKLDMQDLYHRLYADVLNGGGIHPRDLFYLHWAMERYSNIYGWNCIGNTITIPRDML